MNNMAYKNPVPRVDSDRWTLHITFKFEDFVTDIEAEQGIIEYFKENGIPKGNLYMTSEFEQAIKLQLEKRLSK